MDRAMALERDCQSQNLGLLSETERKIERKEK